MPPKKAPVEEKKLKFGRPGNTLRLGLVGLPNVGKSTTFNFLSKCCVPAENFPFCTIDPHEAVVEVPDSRFDWLCETFKPKSEVKAVLKIWDIAGLVPNAHQGEGLGNAFLSHIQAVDGIFHVCRAFSSEDIIHTEGDIDPVRDIEIINNELIQKDLVYCSSRCVDAEKKIRANPKLKVLKDELEVLEKARSHLEAGTCLRLISDWTNKDIDILNGFTFLTTKPVIYLVNMSEKDFIRQKNKFLAKIMQWVKENGGGPVIPFSAEFESGYVSAEDKKEYLDAAGAKRSMFDKIITTGYEYLDLIHFFTCGSDEVRCWTVQKGSKAPQAAGTIHSDMERGFICAETYKFEDIKEHGSEADVKANGKLLQQGKNYEVQDGDICFFKFNVSGKK